MPIYEYANDTDGEVIELLRPMADADKPVEDPSGRNRKFMRRHSVFGVSGAGAAENAQMPTGGCCPCGNAQSMCGRN